VATCKRAVQFGEQPEKGCILQMKFDLSFKLSRRERRRRWRPVDRDPLEAKMLKHDRYVSL
jgi:hypothetical protein